MRIVRAASKINLHLAIRGRRTDGFHDLESVFLPLDFGDILSFEPLSERLDELDVCDLRMVWNIPHRHYAPIPVEKNLVYRAVSLFRERTGWRRGVRITLEKRIPAGAGLGGGSADAAYTLRALDEIAGTALPFETLRAMGAELGSDVPFFLYGAPAFVNGRGERVERLSCPQDFWVLLAAPPFGSDTTRAYQLLDEARAAGNRLENGSLSCEELAADLRKPPLEWRYYNDFLPVFLKGEHKQEYTVILETLKEGGADFCSLSGSGSTCFGIFILEETAEYTKKKLMDGKNFVQISHFSSCLL